MYEHSKLEKYSFCVKKERRKMLEIDNENYNRKLLVNYLNNKITAKKMLTLWKTKNTLSKGYAQVC